MDLFDLAVQRAIGGGGGTDVSDTTAVASDVASGKYFYLANGTKTVGTASGGAYELAPITITNLFNLSITVYTANGYQTVAVNNTKTFYLRAFQGEAYDFIYIVVSGDLSDAVLSSESSAVWQIVNLNPSSTGEKYCIINFDASGSDPIAFTFGTSEN